VCVLYGVGYEERVGTEKGRGVGGEEEVGREDESERVKEREEEYVSRGDSIYTDPSRPLPSSSTVGSDTRTQGGA
jgi:hypothetical protein